MIKYNIKNEIPQSFINNYLFNGNKVRLIDSRVHQSEKSHFITVEYVILVFSLFILQTKWKSNALFIRFNLFVLICDTTIHIFSCFCYVMLSFFKKFKILLNIVA